MRISAYWLVTAPPVVAAACRGTQFFAEYHIVCNFLMSLPCTLFFPAHFLSILVPWTFRIVFASVLVLLPCNHRERDRDQIYNEYWDTYSSISSQHSLETNLSEQTRYRGRELLYVSDERRRSTEAKVILLRCGSAWRVLPMRKCIVHVSYARGINNLEIYRVDLSALPVNNT